MYSIVTEMQTITNMYFPRTKIMVVIPTDVKFLTRKMTSQAKSRIQVSIADIS